MSGSLSTTPGSLSYNSVAAETTRAMAAEGLLSPLASPSFTGTIGLSGTIVQVGGENHFSVGAFVDPDSGTPRAIKIGGGGLAVGGGARIDALGVGGLPNAGVLISVAGTSTIGLDTSAATLTAALRMASGQIIAFEGTTQRVLGYSASGLQYSAGGVPFLTIADSGTVTVGALNSGGLSATTTTNIGSTFTFSGNANGAYPPTAFGGVTSFNFSAGQGEVDNWNAYTGAVVAQRWYQMTATGTATLLASLSSAGNFNAVSVSTPALTLAAVPQSPYTASPLFGTGADGSAVISSGTTSITRDMHYTNLTINGTGSIFTSGYRIFVSGTLDITSAPVAAIIATGGGGGAGAGSTGGNGAGGGIQQRSVPGFYGANAGNGGNGSTGTGAVGGSAWSPVIANGGATGVGGAGGLGSTGSAGGGGNATPISGQNNQYNIQFPTPNPSFMMFTVGTNPVTVFAGVPGSGGGAGSGDGTVLGGGGGGGGGPGRGIAISARYISRGASTALGAIQAISLGGGVGTSSTSGNAGGGGGGASGGGGFIHITAEALIGSVATGALDVSGGAGGAGGNGFGTGKGGNGGTGGNSGNVQTIILNGGIYTCSTFNAAGTAGAVTSTITGAAGGAAAILRVNL